MIRLLLVEDDVNLSYIIQGGLEDMIGGYEVTIAPNGKEGLETYRQMKPDIIVADIEMPVMDGYQAARAIRAMDRPDAREIPIIAMTADAFSEDIRRAMDSGMSAHIAKPIDIRELLRVLQRCLS